MQGKAARKMGEQAKFLMNVLNSSEMFCSLKSESMGGCPYDMFTSRDVAVLSSLSALCAIVFLVAGA